MRLKLFASQIVVGLLANLVTAWPAPAEPPTQLLDALPAPPAETRALFERWRAATNANPPRFGDDTPLYKQLVAAPGADLCFLEGALGNGDYATGWSEITLGAMNTPRTFGVIVRELEDADMFRREWATSMLQRFPPAQTADLLAKRVADDPHGQVRRRAAEVLATSAHPPADTPAVRAALRKALSYDDLFTAFYAAGALGKLREPAGLQCIRRRLPEARGDPDLMERAMHALAAQRSKGAIDLAVTEFTTLCRRDPKREELATCVAANVLLDAHAPPRDRFRPWLDPPPHPETPQQWAEWWARTAPTLNDDLTPKSKPIDDSTIRAEDVHADPARISVSVSLDEPTYRVGDPIRLTMRMTNTADRPCRVYLPFVPSGWWGTMAYAIHLTRDGKPLVDLAPSNAYNGSYGGPPKWRVLLAGETFEDTACLQRWIEHLLDMPLGEGEYELRVGFDPSKFAQIEASPGGILHRWDAPPVKFQVRGEPRRDPAEILDVIARKAQLKWMLDDLIGERSDRRDVALSAIREYGDSRLAPYFEQRATENTDNYAVRALDDLRTYERRRVNSQP